MTQDTPSRRVRLLCPACGSESIVSDAAARWCVETQQWGLSSTMDVTICDDCGEEFNNPREEPLP